MFGYLLEKHDCVKLIIKDETVTYRPGSLSIFLHIWLTRKFDNKLQSTATLKWIYNKLLIVLGQLPQYIFETLNRINIQISSLSFFYRLMVPITSWSDTSFAQKDRGYHINLNGQLRFFFFFFFSVLRKRKCYHLEDQ